MSLITTISGVPLFTTVQEALAYALKRGSKSYHIHHFNGQRGFMGGVNHASTIAAPIINTGQTPITRTTPAVVITPVVPRATVRSQPASAASISSGGGSGSGGGSSSGGSSGSGGGGY